MPPQRRSQSSIIRKHMAQILGWVDEGYTLASIHSYMKEERIIKCGQSNFLRSYYKFRNSDEEFLADGNGTTTKSTMDFVVGTEAEPIHDQIASVEEEPVTAPKVNRALIQGFDFEENQRLARFAFKQAREQQ